jgi:hypothetical protein
MALDARVLAFVTPPIQAAMSQERLVTVVPVLSAPGRIRDA